MTGPIRHVPRSRDDELLSWVRQRAEGKPASAIAKAAGINSGMVVAATNTVRDADLKESGEDPDSVKGGYW